jgi:hypothetical protein
MPATVMPDKDSYKTHYDYTIMALAFQLRRFSQRLIPRCLEFLTYKAIVAANRVNETTNT